MCRVFPSTIIIIITFYSVCCNFSFNVSGRFFLIRKMWITIALALVAFIVVFFSTNRRYRWFYIIAKTYRRDIRVLVAFYKIQKYAKECLKEGKTVSSEFLIAAQHNPTKIAFHFEGQARTFEEMENFANKVARYFMNEGFRKGDTIALLLENCPEYPAFWLGVSQLGIRTALINTNLVKDPLLHCLKTVNSQAIIFGSHFASRISHIRKSLQALKLYEFQDNANVSGLFDDSKNLKQQLEMVSGEALDSKYKVAEPRDPLVYIFTSGTTGLPKAAVLTNLRSLVMLKTMYILSEYRSDDIAYVPLPLYHIAGGIGGVGQTLISGATCVLAKKFSATNYFSDCEKYNVTVSQYIGEICRYLLALPKEFPIKHNIRIMTGNGLRPQLWNKFVERFNIKQVFEIYASTEGISNMLNIDNTPGAIGFVPRYLSRFYPARLIKCDEATGEAVRNSEGFCMECGVDEPGLAIGKINPNKTVANFEGYTDKTETQKKILRNVFTDGDMYFNSGDVLVYDELGYFYFRDRTGDTFRWKGENVSTSEIESVISGIIELGDVVVFGVEIPNTDGKAGMAAIVQSNKNVNLDALVDGLKLQLPGYAIPVFIRILKSVQMTGTYKMQKTELKSQAYNIYKIEDPIYFYNSKLGKYVSLTQPLYENIVNGTIRV